MWQLFMVISLLLCGLCVGQFPTAAPNPGPQTKPTTPPPPNNINSGGISGGGMMPPFGPMQPQHPSAVHFVGTGYNILNGNPDGEFWGNAGDDPGLLLTKKILHISQVNAPPELEIEHRDSCHTSHEYNLIYSAKTYQDKLREGITTSGSVDPALTDFAFTLSNGYNAILQQTTKHHYVFQDYTTLCNMGHARFKLNLAQSDHLSVSREFAASVCRLPQTFDRNAYTKFIDDWGTHMITEVEVGKKVTYRYITSLATYMNFLMKNVSDEVTIGGAMGGYPSSYMVDIDSFKYRAEYRALVGTFHDSTGNGDYMYNDEIELVMQTLDGALDPSLWYGLQYFIQQGVCPQQASALLATWKQNLGNALAAYPITKGASQPADRPLAMPLTWPIGTYGLPEPKSGCPGHFNWSEGMRHETTDSVSPNNQYSNPNHFKGTLSTSVIESYYCIKETALKSPYGITWPAGDYCIYQYGNACPYGFQSGYVKMDDDDTANNHNTDMGALPDGSYNKDTLTYYCCRNDGSYLVPIILPMDQPFYLFKNQHRCQNVKEMVVHEEIITFDNDDSGSYGSSSHSSYHPADDIVNSASRGHTSTLHYCYYESALNSGPAIG